MASSEPFADLRKYFEQREWEEMSDYEKERCRNVLLNYKMMIQLGLNPKKPDFMDPKKRFAPSVSSDSEDEEWTPEKEKPQKKPRFCPPLAQRQRTESTIVKSAQKQSVKAGKKRENSIQARYTVSGLGVNQTESKNSSTRVILDPFLGFADDEPSRTSDKLERLRELINKLQKEIESIEETINPRRKQERRYPKRNVPKINYEEGKIPDDDDYIYCDDCDREWEGDCPVHGPLLIIRDTEVPADGSDPLRADKTVPPELEIGMSMIYGAGKGVWTKVGLPKGIRLGPYEGVIKDEPNKEGYCWQITRNRRPLHFVDAWDTSRSNWMRYVNCARHEEEQNVIAFQFHGQIYYRTFRFVPPNVELLVWYGEQFGRELGIDPVEFRKALYKKTSKDIGDIYPCLHCCMAFSSYEYLERHLKRCRHTQVQKSSNETKRNNCTEIKRRNVHEGYVKLSVKEEDRAYAEQHKGDIYPCLHCYMTFSAYEYLERHLKYCRHAHVQKSSDEMKGNYCTEMKRRNVYEEYIKLSEKKEDWVYVEQLKGNSIECGLCNLIYADELSFSDHVCFIAQVNQLIEDVSCPSESKVMTRTSEKDDKENMEGKDLSVNTCLESKLSIHSGEKTHGCEYLEQVSVKNSYYSSNRRIENGGKSFNCEGCGKFFTQNSICIHSVVKTYNCQHCGKKFSNNSHLRRHLLIHTGEKPYKCQHCGKNFSVNSTLRTHLLIHTGEKPYKCQHCGKNFSRDSCLRRHLLIHTGEKPYKCQHCGKNFSVNSHLRTHLLIHTGEKPYKCQHCGKNFSVNSTLRTHLLIHTGEKPYKCQHCGKNFSVNSTLRTHLLIHTGEKPYKCQHCGKKFNQNSNLRKHILIHTGEVSKV